MVEHETDESGSAYRAFLVRLWQDRPEAPWRASAQSVQTGEIVRFARLPALCAFLNAQALDPASDNIQMLRKARS